MRFRNKLFGTFASLLFVGACADLGSSSSNLSGTGGDAGVQAGDCTLTQGYWKNHEEAWPVSSLELGNVTYSKAELLEILRTPVKGNGLISLAHQLIAAKLNVAAGADDAAIAASINAADALIGDLEIGVDSVPTSETSELVGKLDAFNNGAVGPGHCDDNGGGSGDDDDCDSDHDNDGVCDGDDDDDHDGDHDCPEDAVCGNGVIEAGETCDDGGVVSNDGCSATCQIELAVCGNGVVEAGEECDDGNVLDGDSCSSVCVCVCPIH